MAFPRRQMFFAPGMTAPSTLRFPPSNIFLSYFGKLKPLSVSRLRTWANTHFDLTVFFFQSSGRLQRVDLARSTGARPSLRIAIEIPIPPQLMRPSVFVFRPPYTSH